MSLRLGRALNVALKRRTTRSAVSEVMPGNAIRGPCLALLRMSSNELTCWTSGEAIFPVRMSCAAPLARFPSCTAAVEATVRLAASGAVMDFVTIVLLFLLTRID